MGVHKGDIYFLGIVHNGTDINVLVKVLTVYSEKRKVECKIVSSDDTCFYASFDELIPTRTGV